METKIRNATLLELPAIVNFARTVGRLISADEIRTWMQVDPEAMFVAEASPGGKLIGCCYGARLATELGFMGSYVVLEEYRGKGIGSKLWKAAKEHLGGRNIGVHAEPEHFKKYVEKEGFCHVEDYVIVFYESLGSFVPTNITSSSNIEIATYFEGNLIDCSNKMNRNVNSSNKCTTHSELVEVICARNIMKDLGRPEKCSIEEKQCNSHKTFGAKYTDESYPSSTTDGGTYIHSTHGELFNIKNNRTKQNIHSKKSLNEFQEISFNSRILNSMDNSEAEEILSKVVAFDKTLHNRDRSFVVRQTFSWSSCLSKVALLEGKVVGYACLRNVITGHWVISPFYADTENIAEILLFELLQGLDFSQAPKGIIIRFPNKNIACKRLVEKFGFRQKVTKISTGYMKSCIKIDISKIYSFHSIVFSNV